MLRIENLEYKIFREVIVRNFSFELNLGEVKTLFGPSGCGKTTILRLISNLVTQTSGKIENSFKKTSYLFQENRLLEHLTAFENIAICMKKTDKNEKKDRILKAFEKVKLTPNDAFKYPSELSGGMAKRVAFVRAILSSPNLLLLDEPFVGLDADTRGVLIEILRKKVEAKALSILLVTHDRNEAVALSDEVLFFSKKGMDCDTVLRVEKPHKERDASFMAKFIDENFKGVVYYD